MRCFWMKTVISSMPTQMVIHGHNMKRARCLAHAQKYKVKERNFIASIYIDFNTF